MVFHWYLSDRKSPQVSRTLLGILGDLKNAIVWMVSNRLHISQVFQFTKPLVTVLKIIIIIIIIIKRTCRIVGLMVKLKVFKQGLGTYFSSRFLLFLLFGSPGRQNLLLGRFSFLFFSFFFFFFFCWLSQSLDFWPGLGDVLVSQNSREFCASHFPGRILSCASTNCLNISNLNFFIITINSFENFSHQRYLMVFYWVWVTANLFKSPGLFSVFWLVIIML